MKDVQTYGDHLLHGRGGKQGERERRQISQLTYSITTRESTVFFFFCQTSYSY